MNNVMLRDMRADGGWSNRSKKKPRSPKEDSSKMGSSKRKSVANHSVPAPKKVRISEDSKSPAKVDENEGLSFEDLMNFDQQLIKKHNQKKKLNSTLQNSASSSTVSPPAVKSKPADKSGKANSRHDKSDAKSSRSQKSSVDTHDKHRHSKHESKSSHHKSSSSQHKSSSESKKSSSSKGQGRSSGGDGDKHTDGRKTSKLDVPFAPAKRVN
jgi:hypothetical protein